MTAVTRSLSIMLGFALSSAWLTLAAATLVVDANGGGQFTAIQPALDAAQDGDTVLVKAGEYVITASLDFDRLWQPGDPGPPKRLRLVSESGSEVTTVRLAAPPDTPYPGLPVVLFDDINETETSSLIEGFTLTGGTRGAVLSKDEVGSPVVSHCRITGNAALETNGAAAVAYYDARLVLVECDVFGNEGKGLSSNGSLEAMRCQIHDNTGSGVIVTEIGGASAALFDCEIGQNGGFGVATAVDPIGRALLRGCLVSRNETGAAGYVDLEDSVVAWNRTAGIAGFGEVLVTNCIVAWNGDAGIRINDSQLTVRHATITGNAAAGIFTLIAHQEGGLIESSIVRDNGGPSFGTVEDDPQAPPSATYTATDEPQPGEGNITADPRFCFDGSLALSQDSPCIGTGARGTTMGAFTGTCEGLVIDDGAQGTRSSGTWATGSDRGSYGPSYTYSSETGATYTYVLLVPATGQYGVSMWWPAHPDAARMVAVEVDHAGGTARVAVDQSRDSGQWNLLGSWTFDGIGRVRVTADGEGAAIADAVRLSPAAATGLVLDDGQPGTTFTGKWTTSGGANPYGARSLYTRDVGAAYLYTFEVPVPGRYEVFAWWTAYPSRLESVPIDIVPEGGATTTRRVDQKRDGGRWNSLGAFPLEGRVTVRIRSLGGGTTCADAVKLEPSPLPPTRSVPLVLDDGDPGTVSSGSWSPSSGLYPHEGDSLFSRQAGAAYDYLFLIPVSGTYSVSLWWSAHPNRPASVPVEVILDTGGKQMHFVDQSSNAGRWNEIGAFQLAGKVTVRIRSTGAGSTCADAVLLTPVAAVPEETVLDNGDPGTSALGAWSPSGGANPYGGSSLYSKQAGAAYIFEPVLPVAGNYEVFLWWTEYPSRLARVPVEVASSGSIRTVYVDQTANGGRWVSIGTFPAAGELTVKIRSLGGGTTCADAVRLVKLP